ncbi:MAG: sigma-70 family RNA polymerase sigma factor [Candidatus Viridilinea halotolerans]|uniref:Sigma-70 family RNA polymerase sigma factor n=1 Tax=Candidatus Viridilinea halotolerans TaxID=2491704 RepID=A0A426TX88_9CHLR|nr:MAG: sigma-70 family RNA polymerase sigma factor [Candidatus Viridilinea halotolerans]
MPPQKPTWSPEEWRQRLRNNDEEAWAIVYPACKRVCLSLLHGWPNAELDPEDMTHHVLAEVLERLDEWDHVQSIQAFVQQRARWRCISQIRAALSEREQRVREYPQAFDQDERPPLIERIAAPAAPTQSDEASSAVVEAAKAAIQAALQHCVAQLSPLDQRILALRMEGVTSAAIGAQLMPPRRKNTVEVRYLRLKKHKLFDCLLSKGITKAAIVRLWGWRGGHDGDEAL